MRNKNLMLIIIIMIIFSSIILVNAKDKEGNVYIIPINEEITPAIYGYVKHNISIAENDPNVAAIIFDIDTYGGRIDSSEKISKLILNTNIPTISFVNTKAQSAGVLISISSDTIVMAPGGTIGSAETIPNTEKTLSMWVSMLRSVAQQKGRSVEIVTAMADKSISIPGVIPNGKLLNLTSNEAKAIGFIDLIEKDYEGILKSLSIPYNNIIKSEITNGVRLANFVSNAYMASILLTIAFAGFLAEIFLPGFGAGGTASIIAFTLYFSGSILAGNAGWITIAIFLVGIMLLTIEAFIPGFGIPGLGGITCVITSIILASDSIIGSIIPLTVSFILTAIILLVIIKYAPKNKHFNKIVLGTELTREKGFSSSSNYETYIGKVGLATTPLRPSGIISIDGDLIDVVSEGQYIEKGSIVQVIKVQGSVITVKNNKE